MHRSPGLGLWEALALLALLPLLLRFIPWKRSPDADRWRTGPELGLGLACGLGFAALSAWWMADFHLRGFPMTASDFSEYCVSVDAVRDGRWGGYSNNRSRLAGWPAGWLAGSLGIIDGLAFSALISTVFVGAALYFWGRALHSRVAGVIVVLLALTIGPVALIPRTMSFYPVNTAIFAWSAAGAALALRYRTLPALLVCGVGAGLALLVDVRGLLWALPALGLGLLACVPRDWKTWRGWAWLPARILMVVGPIALSYPVGTQVYSKYSVTLESQAEGFQKDRSMHVGLDYQPRRLPTSYLWGHSDPRYIPYTLQGIAELSGQLPEKVKNVPETVYARMNHIEPWYEVALGALALTGLALLRRPWQLIALSGLLPFAVTLKNTSDYLVFARYLQAPMLIFALLMGAALTALALDPMPKLPRGGEGEPAPAEDGRWRWRVWARPAAAVLLAAMLAFGAVPSYLSPLASWRTPFFAGQDPRNMIRLAEENGTIRDLREMTCLRPLIRDVHKDGHPAGSRLYPHGGM